jgi:hypothetical protein
VEALRWFLAFQNFSTFAFESIQETTKKRTTPNIRIANADTEIQLRLSIRSHRCSSTLPDHPSLYLYHYACKALSLIYIQWPSETLKVDVAWLKTLGREIHPSYKRISYFNSTQVISSLIQTALEQLAEHLMAVSASIFYAIYRTAADPSYLNILHIQELEHIHYSLHN